MKAIQEDVSFFEEYVQKAKNDVKSDDEKLLLAYYREYLFQLKQPGGTEEKIRSYEEFIEAINIKPA